jgi:predicted Zn-dependent protease
MTRMMTSVVLGAVFLGVCTPAHAQLGGLIDKAQQAQSAKKKLDSLTISEDEEIKLGTAISQKVRTRFGVVQDSAVTRYVTLVGLTLAAETERPKLPWTFIVLDTDGVNAFAAPGGFVHITRGALGLIKNEAELAAVLGHEIGHVVHKHTVDSIRKANAEKLASDSALSDRGPYLDKLTNLAYDMVLEGKFDRNDELDADRFSGTVTPKLGYAPAALADFLTRLDERNKDVPTRNGLFASHPDTKERIEKIRKQAGPAPGVTVMARYGQNIKYDVPPVTAIATVAGSSGLTGSTAAPKKDDQAKKDDSKKEEPKKDEPKKGFGLGSLKKAATPEQNSAQVTASGGSRGVGADRDAKGGDNPALVKVTVTAAEITAFKKGIA